MTGCATSGNKVRKLEFCLAEARMQGADVIITCGGVQSNHARAAAILGAQLGIRVHLLLRGDKTELNGEGNHFLDKLAGATIECYPSSIYVPQFQRLVEQCCANYRRQGLRPYFITTGASDATGVWGYIKACEEIRDQAQHLNVQFDHIICATGSGGTLAGLVAGTEIHGIASHVWGINVCDSEDYFLRKARQDLRDWNARFSMNINQGLDVDTLPIRVIDGYVGEGYGKAGFAVYELIRSLAREEGVFLDPTYTGKAFHGMLSELEKGRFKDANDILFIHTGGLFGLFADKQLYPDI